MRLICPKCDAQYEVEAALIPAEGRDVQCSACAEVWFHGPEDIAEAEVSWTAKGDIDPPPAADEAAPEAEPEDHQILRRHSLDESMLSVLREEAERETRARAVEAARNAPRQLEIQPELGLPEAEAAPRLRIRPRDEAEPPVAHVQSAAEAARPSRRELLPDIEEINSTLDASTADRKGEANVRVPEPPERQRSGFRRGFVLMLVLAALAAVAYAEAPRLARALPAAEPLVNGYVATVDQARRGLDRVIGGLLARLQG